MKYLVDVLMTVLLCSAFVAVAQEKQNTTLSLAQLNKSLVPAMVASWPQKLTEMAMKLMTKYGVPNEATDSMLVWRNNAPCKRTLSYRLEIPHEFPAPHSDFLQQVIDYRVPPDKFSELANYHGGVIVERIKGELSARCDMEELNMLALNQAHLQRKTGVEDAVSTTQKPRSHLSKAKRSFTRSAWTSRFTTAGLRIPIDRKPRLWHPLHAKQPIERRTRLLRAHTPNATTISTLLYVFY